MNRRGRFDELWLQVLGFQPNKAPHESVAIVVADMGFDETVKVVAALVSRHDRAGEAFGPR